MILLVLYMRFIVYEVTDEGSVNEIFRDDNLVALLNSNDLNDCIVVDFKNRYIFICLEHENSIRRNVTIAWAAKNLHDKLHFPITTIDKSHLELIAHDKIKYRYDKDSKSIDFKFTK